jgi:hypothetical protein
MTIALEHFVTEFAFALQTVDGRMPIARNVRSGSEYQPGIGPHTESATLALVMAEMRTLWPERYISVSKEVRYPNEPRRKCDLCIGSLPVWDWCIEVKMLRVMGDNGKPNDNILMHILSPYAANNSAVTDCEKLSRSHLPGRKAIVIYGYEYNHYPMEPVVRAFELLAADRVLLGERSAAKFEALVHPVHRCGAVSAWEILGPKA